MNEGLSMKKLILSAALALAVTACSGGEEGDATPVADNGEVNIYSARHYDTDLALYDEFTAETGIAVNRIEADSDALIERIESEGEFSPADIFISRVRPCESGTRALSKG